MTLHGIQRFGAVCGVLLGLSIGVPGLIEAFTGEIAATGFVIGTGVAAFAAPALTGLYLRQRTVAGRFGAVAYAVNLLGLGLFGAVAFALNLVVFYLDEAVTKEVLAGPTRIALLLSTAVFVVGTVLFTASMVRTKVHPALPAWGYGITLIALALLAPLPDTPVTSVVHVLACLSLGWLSVSSWSAAGTGEQRPVMATMSG